MMKRPKILSPAGYFDCLRAAIDAKADCVYFGIRGLNMRMLSSNNFEPRDLKEISQICKKNNIESYLTLNSVIYNNEISYMRQIIDEAKKNDITAIIAHDFAVIGHAKKTGCKIHLSTQANISNIEALKFYSGFADLAVLARELTLEQISEITACVEKENIRGPSGKLLEIELFIHGALCTAISGKCYMSLAQYNKSANRGSCLQACRRRYKVIELETNKELLIDNDRIMSLKDLCTIAHIDKLINTNADVFKIEGRARKPDYVYTATKCYKEAVDAYFSKTYTQEKIDNWIKELSNVYNRGFWHGGYYLGEQTDIWCSSHGSRSQIKKTYIGQAVNYFSKIQVGEFLIHSHQLKIGDEVLIIGPTTGVIKTAITSIFTDKKTDIAYKGEKAAIKLDQKIRRNDKLYLLEKNEPLQA